MPTVLVVDDSAVDRRMAGGLLEPKYEIRYAENGHVALNLIDQIAPDVVVTDLQMPDMDGLELVTSVRLKHPKVPIILMTAHGSETLATEALESGAASYVPKDQLSSQLCETVDEIVALVRADRTYERLIECSISSQFEFSLDNDLDLIEPLVDLLQQMATSMGVCDSAQRIRLGVALEQALRNAVLRGNLEIQGEIGAEYDQRRNETPFSERRVYVSARITRDTSEFLIRDEGPGFDTTIAAADTIEDTSRRGLVLMRSFMDELIFNEQGNELVMIKRRPDVA